MLITGKRGNAVLLPEADWNAIQETLHLVSIPGMRETDPGERLDGLKRQHRVSEDDPHQQPAD